MNIFITGTGTNVGKTLICSWLCLHTNYSYFKPIQTGAYDDTDSRIVCNLSSAKIYNETYIFKNPLSPHLAALLEDEEIDITKIQLPSDKNLIVEGAGGVLVPINKQYLMVDLIKRFDIPTIIVAVSQLGTINHTLLSLEALRSRSISILGVILTGKLDQSIADTIEFYGKVKVLAQIPYLSSINKKTLSEIPFSANLKQILNNDKTCD